MAEDIKKIIARYLDVLIQMGINPQKLILFGSHANGTQKEWSDIDLLVVANFPSSKCRIELMGMLGIAAARIMEPIEAIPCTPEEYANAAHGTLIGDEVKPNGIEITIDELRKYENI